MSYLSFMAQRLTILLLPSAPRQKLANSAELCNLDTGWLPLIEHEGGYAPPLPAGLLISFSR